jgi:hypothetical protein
MSVANSLTPDESQQVIFSFLKSAYSLPDPIAQIITAQSGHETAGWTSSVYKTLNNAFGFGWNGSSYYGYNSVEESVTDVVNWLSNNVPDFQDMTDPGIYATALKSANYYEDSETNYVNGIENYLNTALTGAVSLVANNPIPSGIIFAGIILIIAFFASRPRKS